MLVLCARRNVRLGARHRRTPTDSPSRDGRPFPARSGSKNGNELDFPLSTLSDASGNKTGSCQYPSDTLARFHITVHKGGNRQ